MSEIELALTKLVGISKKFCLLDVVAQSHGLHGVGPTMTLIARVLAFDSSPDGHKTLSPIKAGEKHTSPPPSMSS
jgi:hypothetical protein